MFKVLGCGVYPRTHAGVLRAGLRVPERSRQVGDLLQIGAEVSSNTNTCFLCQEANRIRAILGLSTGCFLSAPRIFCFCR